VLVLDDEPLTRVALAGVLDSQDDITVVCQASAAAEAVAYATSHRVDVAFLDIYLGPGPNGIDVAWALRQANPAVGIVFLTSLTDPRILGDDYRGVPKGSVYLVKSDIESVSHIISTIDMARGFLSAGGKKGDSLPPTPFTPHQIQILRLISEGLSNQEIAKQLVISEKAVEATISRLSKALKLPDTPGVNRRVHIVRTYLNAMGLTLP
jgi:DNA-binding NarL/FixJ family response regulator